MNPDTTHKATMTSIFPDKRSLQVWSCLALLLLGMVYSPFLQSLAMVGLVLCVLLSWDENRDFPFVWNPAWRVSWRGFWRRPDYWTPVLYVGLVLFSFHGLQEPAYWLERLRIKTPFLFMPLVFFMFPYFSGRVAGSFWYFLAALLALSSLGIVLNYVWHFESVQAQLRMGQPLPMPCNHIRYSLLHVMGMAGGIHLLEKGFYLRSPRERGVLVGVLLWLVVAQHILAVRSGLVAMYAVLLVAALRYVWRSRRWLVGVLLLGFLVAGPLTAYYAVPSLRTRIDYARYDLDMLRKGVDRGALSDGSRWVSLEIGWKLFRNAPWTGVGAGNLRYRVEQEYAARYPGFQRRLMPHNQLLFVAAGTGVVGLAVFLFSFFLPLLYKKKYLSFPMTALHLVALVSFIAEATIENAMGVAFFVVFWGVGMVEWEENIGQKKASYE